MSYDLELEEILLKHCYNMKILKPKDPKKKTDAILDSLIAAIIRCNLTKEEINNCIRDINNDNVLNLDFFKNGGNLFKDYISIKWVDFAKTLWRQRSVGLGTPNAASGEGELMFLFLSKKITKPTKGDLQIDNQIIELKGDNVRVQGKIRGNDFRNKTLEICKEFKLKPNLANKTNLEAVEIEKVGQLYHWNVELAKLELKKQKEFVSRWLHCLDNRNHNESVEKIFKLNKFNQDTLIQEIVKILYAVMVNTENFDKFVILGDGHNVKVISKNLDEFNKMVDDGKIEIASDYFRINQNYNIGWYIA